MPLVRQTFQQVPANGSSQSGVMLPAMMSWRKLLADETWDNTLNDGLTQPQSGTAGQVVITFDPNTSVAYDEDDFNAYQTWRQV